MWAGSSNKPSHQCPNPTAGSFLPTSSCAGTNPTTTSGSSSTIAAPSSSSSSKHQTSNTKHSDVHVFGTRPERGPNEARTRSERGPNEVRTRCERGPNEVRTRSERGANEVRTRCEHFTAYAAEERLESSQAHTLWKRVVGMLFC